MDQKLPKRHTRVCHRCAGDGAANAEAAAGKVALVPLLLLRKPVRAELSIAKLRWYVRAARVTTQAGCGMLYDTQPQCTPEPCGLQMATALSPLAIAQVQHSICAPSTRQRASEPSARPSL